jgi:hypothetical protein
VIFEWGCEFLLEFTKFRKWVMLDKISFATERLLRARLYQIDPVGLKTIQRDDICHFVHEWTLNIYRHRLIRELDNFSG